MKQNIPPIENHPMFETWSKALDRYKEAADHLSDIRSRPEHDPEKIAARAEFYAAQSEYWRLSEELGC